MGVFTRSGWTPKVLHFSEGEWVELATAYGALQMRRLDLGLENFLQAQIDLDTLRSVMLDLWGFDMAGPLDIHIDTDAKRIEFRQKWWNRAARKPAKSHWVKP